MKDNRKERLGWYFYDWANSSYPLVISTAIFPIYYSMVARSDGSDYVHLLGFQFYNSALYSYAIALSFLLVSAITPLLSGVADYSGHKKRFLKIFCAIGSASCASLYFFDGHNLLPGLISVILGSIGFSGSLVFYNAFLPEIAEPVDQDAVSARGFAMGYIGSSLLLILNILMISRPSWFAIDTTGMSEQQVFLHIAPWTFVMVAIWWFGWSQLTFRWLNDRPSRTVKGNVFSFGFREILKVWGELQRLTELKIYLAAFFVYSMGVQTVILVSTFFGTQVIGMKSDQMLTVLLLIQFIAIGGSYLFSWLSSRIGNIRALMIALSIWISVCVCAALIDTSLQFSIVSLIVGLVLGGTQSLSRSTYSKLLPKTSDHASYFSFYDICEKIGIVFGMFMYGWISDVTGNMRNSVLGLIGFFVMGLILLFLIPARLRGRLGHPKKSRST